MPWMSSGLGAHGLTGPKPTNKNHRKSPAAHPGEAAAAWQWSSGGPSWEQVDSGDHRGTGTADWGSLGRWLALSVGVGDVAQQPARDDCVQWGSETAGSTSPLAPCVLPWVQEVAHHPGAHIGEVWWLGALQVVQEPLLHRGNKAGLAGWVWVASGFEGTATTPRGPGTAVPLPPVLGPLPLGSCGCITSTPCPARS